MKVKTFKQENNETVKLNSTEIINDGSTLDDIILSYNSYKPTTVYENTSGLVIDTDGGATPITISGLPDLTPYCDNKHEVDVYFAYGGDAQRKNTFLLTSNLGGAWFVMTRDENGGNDYFVATIYVTNMKSTSWTFATKAKKSINGSNVINTVTYKPIRLYKVVVRKISD